MNNLIAKLRGALKSWTAWVNSVIGIVAASLIPFLPTIKDALAENLPTLQPYLTPKMYLIGIVALAVVNLALRFKTNTALQDK